MTYKNYPTRKSVPSRMGRKRMRRDVFTFNRKAAKARRKAMRLERQQKEVENAAI